MASTTHTTWTNQTVDLLKTNLHIDCKPVLKQLIPDTLEKGIRLVSLQTKPTEGSRHLRLDAWYYIRRVSVEDVLRALRDTGFWTQWLQKEVERVMETQKVYHVVVRGNDPKFMPLGIRDGQDVVTDYIVEGFEAILEEVDKYLFEELSDPASVRLAMADHSFDQMLRAYYLNGKQDKDATLHLVGRLRGGSNLLHTCIKEGLLLDEFTIESQSLAPWRALAEPLRPVGQFKVSAFHRAVFDGRPECLQELVLWALRHGHDIKELRNVEERNDYAAPTKGLTCLELAEQSKNMLCYNILAPLFGVLAKEGATDVNPREVRVEQRALPRVEAESQGTPLFVCLADEKHDWAWVIEVIKSFKKEKMQSFDSSQIVIRLENLILEEDATEVQAEELLAETADMHLEANACTWKTDRTNLNFFKVVVDRLSTPSTDHLPALLPRKVQIPSVAAEDLSATEEEDVDLEVGQLFLQYVAICGRWLGFVGAHVITSKRMSAASDGAVHGTPQGTPGSAQSAPAAPARRMGGKGKGWTPSMPPPQMPVPPAYTQPYPAMSQLRWEQDVYGHWWYSDGQHWWYGHGGSHRFTAPPAGTIPTATSSIGASWQYVNPETTRHPSGSKPPREPAHPKKPSKPESQKKSPNKKKPPAKEKKKAPPPPPEEDEDDDDDDDGSEGGSSSSYEEVEYEESEEEDGEFTDDPSVAATPRGTPRAAQTPKAAAKAKQAAKPAAKPKPAAPAKAKAGKSRPADPPKDPQPPKAFHRAAKVVKKKPKVEKDQDPPSAPPSGPPSHGGSAAPSEISTVRTESIKELLKGRGPYKPTRHTHWADAEDDWEYDDEEDSFGDPDNEDLKPSWQKKTCKDAVHQKRDNEAHFNTGTHKGQRPQPLPDRRRPAEPSYPPPERERTGTKRRSDRGYYDDYDDEAKPQPAAEQQTKPPPAAEREAAEPAPLPIRDPEKFRERLQLPQKKLPMPQRQQGKQQQIQQPQLLHTRQVNWTMMHGWERIRRYQSDDEEVDSSSSAASESEEEDLAYHLKLSESSQASQSKQAKEKIKVKLLTVLRSLLEDEKDEETIQRLRKKEKRLAERATARATGATSSTEARPKAKPKHKKPERLEEDVGLSTEDLVKVLPKTSKEEKKILYKQLKKDQEREILEIFGRSATPERSMLKRPEQRKGGYGYSTPDRRGKDQVQEPPEKQENLPTPVKKKRLEEFRKSLYEAALDKRGRLIPTADQEACRHKFDRLVGIHGTWRPTVMSPSRHPILGLLNMGSHPNPKQWRIKPLEELRQRLLSDPHSFALVQDALDSISDSGSEVPQEVLKVAVHGPETQQQLAMWQETMEDEAVETLDAINAPKVFKPQLDPMSSDEGSISEGESETSHDPDYQDEDSTTSNETEAEEEFHEILTSGCAGETEILSKGQRRRILAAAKGISEAAMAEAERRSCPEKVPRIRRLRTGYKILEIFTWSCLLSRFAYGLGWEYLEPLTLPGGYPLPLCRAIMRAAHTFLDKQANDTRTEVYMLDDQVPEEAIQEGEEGIDEEEQRIQSYKDESEDDLEEEERRPISQEVKRAVEFAHRQLGHPSRDTLVRMLRISGANDDAIRHARRWRCDVCRMQQPPKHPLATTATSRPFAFNRVLHIDIKYLFDTQGRKYPCLSIVDLGTVYHAGCMLKTRRSDYVARKFLVHWVQLFGAPGHIYHDQGGEFELSFTQLLEQMAAPSTLTGSHAGWQLAVGERHGGILGTMVGAITTEHVTEGFHGMKLALSSALAAKNMTITRDGFSPNQRLALIRMDVQEKMKRAILRKPGVDTEGRALLLATPNMRLATKEELAMNESAKEDAETIGQMLRDPERDNAYHDQTHFRGAPKRKHIRDDPERKRARLMMRGTKSIRELLKSRFGFKEQLRKRKVQPQPPEKGDPVAPRKKVKKALPPPPAAESQDSMEEYTPSQAPEPEAPQEGQRPMLPAPSSAPAEPPTEAPRAEDVPVPPMDENEWLEEYRHLPQEERRRILQDDVPHGIKRKGGITEEDADRAVKRLRSNFCAATAASTVYGTLQNEWVSRYEVELLRQLTGLPVTAARIHRAPRKRLQRPPKMVSRSRLSILIGKDPASTFIVNEKDAEVAAHPRRRASFEWRGLTMFYRTEDPSKPTEVFVELPDGIHGVTLITSEAAEFQQMRLSAFLRHTQDVDGDGLGQWLRHRQLMPLARVVFERFFNREKLLLDQPMDVAQNIDPSVVPFLKMTLTAWFHTAASSPEDTHDAWGAWAETIQVDDDVLKKELAPALDLVLESLLRMWKALDPVCKRSGVHSMVHLVKSCIPPGLLNRLPNTRRRLERPCQAKTKVSLTGKTTTLKPSFKPVTPVKAPLKAAVW
ncbi:unnamed protein product [Durusdinium trenchii]|uniref:Integrase catalytic domain-containing protein n=1 Tax=Durusdinium trenchii TaxID=1381693 RepID=A0ABP0SQZ5_9DINO